MIFISLLHSLLRSLLHSLLRSPGTIFMVYSPPPFSKQAIFIPSFFKASYLYPLLLQSKLSSSPPFSKQAIFIPSFFKGGVGVVCKKLSQPLFNNLIFHVFQEIVILADIILLLERLRGKDHTHGSRREIVECAPDARLDEQPLVGVVQ